MKEKQYNTIVVLKKLKRETKKFFDKRYTHQKAFSFYFTLEDGQGEECEQKKNPSFHF